MYIGKLKSYFLKQIYSHLLFLSLLRSLLTYFFLVHCSRRSTQPMWFFARNTSRKWWWQWRRWWRRKLCLYNVQTWIISSCQDARISMVMDYWLYNSLFSISHHFNIAVLLCQIKSFITSLIPSSFSEKSECNYFEISLFKCFVVYNFLSGGQVSLKMIQITRVSFTVKKRIERLL